MRSVSPGRLPWMMMAMTGLLLAGGCASLVSATDSVTSSSSDRPSSTRGAPSQPTSAPEPATTTPSSTVVLRAPIVVGFAGDTSFTGGLSLRNPFGEVLDLLRTPDLMVVNLETAVADDDVGRPPVPKPFLFRSSPASLDLLVDAGVDAVSLANNHTLDFGPAALEQTLRELDARGIGHVGGGVDSPEAYTPLVLDAGGWRIGLVGLSRVPCDWSVGGENLRPQVAWACPALMGAADAMVAEAQARSDVTVVMVHGGEEGVFCPSPFMVELNRHWAELGVDLVVNGHPHVLQGITSIGDTMVVGSTGNFAFPSARGVTANSGVFLTTISEQEPSAPRIALQMIPLRADGGVLERPGTEQATSILDQVNAVSSGWRLDRDGRAQPAPEHTGTC